MTGGKALPKEIAEQIIDRTDGVPLFIEELTKSVVESGLVTKAGDHYSVAGPTAPLAIPTTLQASLLARLDRLAPTREVAQIGAALGRSFSHELISAVAQMPQQKLDDALEQLVNAELIFRRGTPPDAEYTFKHALVQDAAYSTLLRSRRQQLHARIAATLESQFPEIVAASRHCLAQHCTEAGLRESDRLLAQGGATGDCAVRDDEGGSAAPQRALELLSASPTEQPRVGEELELLITLGHALMAARAAVRRNRENIFARAICASSSGNPSNCFRRYGGFGWTPSGESDVRRLARSLMSFSGWPIGQTIGHSCSRRITQCVQPRFRVGDPQATRNHAEQGMQLYEREQHRSLAFLFGGHDPGVCCCMHSVHGTLVPRISRRARVSAAAKVSPWRGERLAHWDDFRPSFASGECINQLCGDVACRP